MNVDFCDHCGELNDCVLSIDGSLIVTLCGECLRMRTGTQGYGWGRPASKHAGPMVRIIDPEKLDIDRVEEGGVYG